MKIIHLIIGMLVCTFFYLDVRAQFPQGNHYQFKGTFDDNFRASTIPLNGHYYVVGNTRTGGQQNGLWRILVCKMGENGSLIWSRTLHIPQLNNASVIGTDIQAGYANLIPSDDSIKPGDNDPDPPGPMANPIADQNTFNYMYISGTVVRSTGKKSMIIIQIDPEANVLWSRYDFNASLSDVDESGVSVESCPNGGAFLVGHTVYNNTGVSCVAIARFSISGNLRWLNRYTDINYQQTEGNFIPHQSCIYEEKLTTSPTAIAVTGEYSGAASNRTRAFVMRINHAGIENWRALCPSNVIEQPNNDTLYDVGWDITTDPNIVHVGPETTIPNFVVTGAIGSLTTTSRYMYMFTITLFGVYDKGYKVFTTNISKNLSIRGSSIAQSINNTDVVILGHSDVKSFGSNKRNFLLEMSPVNGTINWSRLLNETEPEFTEHITKSWNRGYIISTTQLGTGKDGIVFYTEQIGRINDSCSDDTLTCDTAHVGSSITLDYERIQDTIVSNVSPVKNSISATNDSCIFLIDPPFECNNCIYTPTFSVCCCDEGGITKYRVCLQFDTTVCSMRNWQIKVSFKDSTDWVSFSSGTNVICYTYSNPGSYLVLFQIQGEFFANGFWRPCVSTVETALLNIPPCQVIPFGYPPCGSVACTPPMKPGINSIREIDEVVYDGIIFPNPAHEKSSTTLSLILPEENNVTVFLTNIEGRLLWKMEKKCKAGTTDILIPTRNLPVGIYPVIIKHNKGQMVRKLTVE